MTVTPLNRLFRLCAGVLATSIALPKVAIAQTPSITRTVPSNYSCYNTEAVAVNDWSTNDPEKPNGLQKITAFGQAAQRAGGQSLRIPGGDTANYWNWENYSFTDANGNPATTDYGNDGSIVNWFVPENGGFTSRKPGVYPFFLPEELPNSVRFEDNNNATLENVDVFISAANAEPIWVMNMTTSFLEKEIDHLKTAVDLGMSVGRIELGNELYFRGGAGVDPATGIGNYNRYDDSSITPPQVGGIQTAEDYAIKAKAWAQAVRAEFPTAEIGLTGVTLSVDKSVNRTDERIQDWMKELQKPRGADNRSALDIADAFTIHPYYSNSEIGATAADIGDRARAGEIARNGIAQLRTILADPGIDPSLPMNAGLANKRMWITEHNIIEPNDNVVIGNTWFGSLMVDMHGHEFLKDERVDLSCAHVLTGNPQWQGIADEIGKVIDPAKRGTASPFTTGTESSPHATAFSQTSNGLVLGKSADIFVDGTATLLHSEEASIAWRVEDEAAGTDVISAINAGDEDETLELPEGEIWEVLTFIGDPWATIDSEEDLEIALEILTGGSILNIPAFSKIIATASLTGDRPRQPADGEEEEPTIEVVARRTPRQPGSLVISDAGVAGMVATAEVVATVGSVAKEPGSGVVSSPAYLVAQAEGDAQAVPEPGAAIGLGLAAAALMLTGRKRYQTVAKTGD